MNASYKNSHINETLEVLTELSRYKPRSAAERRTGFESGAERISNWSMGIAVALMIPAWGLAAWVHFGGALNEWIKIIALIIVTLSCLLAISALLLPILATSVILFRWKDISLQNLLDDIKHEQAMVYTLSHHKSAALVDAKCWLELRIKRIEARVAHFFGDKSAVLGLLASGYFFAKEFESKSGALNWVGSTLSSGINPQNFPNMALMMVGAGVVGLSLGAVMIRHIAARYRYQVELIDMAKR
jgi:cation transport ATPase